MRRETASAADGRIATLAASSRRNLSVGSLSVVSTRSVIAAGRADIARLAAGVVPVLSALPVVTGVFAATGIASARIAAILMALAFSTFSLAAQTPISDAARAPDAEETLAFQGVGRVTVAGRGFCTGSLISQRLVLTAAHCLYDARSLQPVPLAMVRFVPGGVGGLRQEALRVVRAAAAPAFHFDGRPRPEAVAADMALLELAQPVAAPLLSAGGNVPGEGEMLLAVAYGHRRISVPGIHEECGIRDRFHRVLVLDCRLGLGGSGAPVFSGAGPARHIVGVVSASGRDPEGNPLTFAVEPGPRLPALRAALSAYAVVTPAISP